MDDQTKELLKQYLSKLLEATEKGIQWTAEQVPLVIQEKLAYDFYQALFYTTVFLLLGIGCAYLTYKILTKWDRHLDTPAIVLTVPVAVVGIIAACAWLDDVLKIAVVPRLYILEWLRGML